MALIRRAGRVLATTVYCLGTAAPAGPADLPDAGPPLRLVAAAFGAEPALGRTARR